MIWLVACILRRCACVFQTNERSGLLAGTKLWGDKAFVLRFVTKCLCQAGAAVLLFNWCAAAEANAKDKNGGHAQCNVLLPLAVGLMFARLD